jgi:polysaccharide export outer membrane protein
MYKITRQFCVLIIAAISAVSCVTQKQLTYLHDADASKVDSINAKYSPRTEHVIRPGDALTVFVSALDKEAVAPYNLPTVIYSAPGSNQVQTTPMLQYYVVDAAGYIEMPVLGKLQVGGLSRPEAEEEIRKVLSQQVIDPTVRVSVVGAKVSVLGEVNRPSQVSMPSGRMTIFDALAAAGDLTPYGRRDNVLITREVNGKLELARLNLGNADIYTSPYYFLQQNDVVYVSPNKVRAIGSTNSGLWLSVVSTALSAATIIVTVVKK